MKNALPHPTDKAAKRNIAKNVQALLADREWTMADLARALDASPMTVNYMARGVKMPGAAFLARVANVLGVTVDDLLSKNIPEPNQVA